MKIFLSIILFFIADIVCGQNSNNENLWSGLGLKMSLHEKFRMDVEHQIRFHPDVTTYQNTFTELGLNFMPIKKLRFNANYRHIFYERGLRHRYVLETHFYFKPKKTNFYFHIRERFQSYVWQIDNSSVSNIRNLVTIGYKVIRLKGSRKSILHKSGFTD